MRFSTINLAKINACSIGEGQILPTRRKGSTEYRRFGSVCCEASLGYPWLYGRAMHEMQTDQSPGDQRSGDSDAELPLVSAMFVDTRGYTVFWLGVRFGNGWHKQLQGGCGPQPTDVQRPTLVSCFPALNPLSRT